MKTTVLSLSLLVAFAFTAGCSTNEAPAEPLAPTPAGAVTVTPAPATPTDEHAGHNHAPGEGHDGEADAATAPFAGMGAPDAPLTPTPEMDKKIAEAEKGTDKKALAAAYADRGTFRMNDEDAGAKVKYRAALDDYRKALDADPQNEEAKKNKEMIESIYKSMGRPIPGEEESSAKK
jgi:hypothetical protein